MSEVPDSPHNPVVNLLKIAREVNRLQTRVQRLRNTTNDDRHALLHATQSLVRMGKDIEYNLQRWPASLETSWHYTLVDADEILFRPESYADQVHVYPSIPIARVWNGWRTIRLNLQMAMNDLLTWAHASLGVDLAQDRQNNITSMHAMIDDICNAVHFLLGNKASPSGEQIASFPVRGPGDNYEKHAMAWGWFYLLVPLRTCQRAPALNNRQRQWIHHSLLRIARIARQYNRHPPPPEPPVLMTHALPSFAFSLPMFPFEDAPHHRRTPLALSRQEYFPIGDSSRFSPNVHPSLAPAQDYFTQSPFSSPPLGATTPGRMASTPPPKKESQQVDLPFFNTTRPDQIKNPEVQKKIRRDVMLHHMRNQDPKAREERQRKAREGSAARAASRREQSAGLSGERRDSEDALSSGGSISKRGSSKKSSTSGKGKGRAN